MKAVRVHAWGSPDDLRLEEIPEPEPKAHEVRVRVAACGVNFADSLLIAGKYQAKPPFPFGPGSEVAGTVSAVGPEVSDFAIGDRVVGLPGHSGFAEEAIVPAATLAPAPEAVAFQIAAALPIAYATSWLALEDKAKLQPGETLLVHGASGGVGLTAVELGKAMGARVIACASSPEKLEVARQYGADELVNSSVEDVRVRVKELTGGRGADVIYDPVGGDAFAASLRCVNFKGRILPIGFASGDVPQIPANIVMVKTVDILGLNFGGYVEHQPELIGESLRDIVQWAAEGKIRPYVSETFTLEQSAEAISHVVARKAKGKVVVVL